MKKLGLQTDPAAERYGRIVSIPAAKQIEDFQASITDPDLVFVPKYGQWFAFWAFVSLVAVGVLFYTAPEGMVSVWRMPF